MSLAAAQLAFLERLRQPEDGDAGLDAYRRTVRANARNALAAAYPVVSRLVGAAFFDEAADRYARRHPSRCGDLHAFGGELAAFLAAYQPARGLAYLPDVARLEWAVHCAAFARDPEPFDRAALAALAPHAQQSARLAAQDGVALIDSVHPIVSIREANQADRDGSLEREWRGEAALVWRDGIGVRVERAGPDAPLLARLLAGEALGDACRDERDAAALPRWVAAGVFSGPVR